MDGNFREICMRNENIIGKMRVPSRDGKEYKPEKIKQNREKKELEYRILNI